MFIQKHTEENIVWYKMKIEIKEDLFAIFFNFPRKARRLTGNESLYTVYYLCLMTLF